MEKFQRKIEDEPVPRIEIISKQTIDKVLKDISRNLMADFTKIPVELISPGDVDFEFLDLFPKVRTVLLHNKSDLEGKLLSLYQEDSNQALVELKKIAFDLGMKGEDNIPGLVYTIMGNKIVFPSFSKERLKEMAVKYATKEMDNIEFINNQAALEYLNTLAEKYLYHEVGHIVYNLIPQQLKNRWQEHITDNEKILTRVRQVQAGNINESMPLPLQVNEAFADIFVPIASAGKHTNRLGDFEQEKLFVEEILLELGFKIKN